MQSSMFFQSADTMSQTVRILHIDSLRGIAVLLMVMVHAAATWNPFSEVQLSILAYVVSGLGGLAAPLFVTLFGWGIVRANLTFQSRLFQFFFFLIAQIAVNLTSPHLFHPFTPGILSLMAIMTLLLPLIFHRKRNSYSKIFVISLSSIIVIQTFFPDLQGTGIWADRVDDASIPIILSNLLLTGTYPLFPWFFFAFFGAMISTQPVNDGKSLEISLSVRLALVVGLMYCSITLVYAQFKNILWAHPTEDAVLTFFPANQSFLIASLTGVVLLWILVQRYSMNILSHTGKLSLSIYLMHFIPLTLMRDFEVTHQWGLQTSTLAVLIYTLAWIPTAVLWQRYWPKASVETLLRAIRKSLF